MLGDPRGRQETLKETLEDSMRLLDILELWDTLVDSRRDSTRLQATLGNPTRLLESLRYLKNSRIL